jgi:hypothetical protein
MGLQGKAALVGAAQYKPEKYSSAPRMFHLEQVADLATQALDDAGMSLADVDGLITVGPQFHKAGMFVPAMAGDLAAGNGALQVARRAGHDAPPQAGI